MEVSDSDLSYEMYCALKFFDRLGKTAPRIVKLMKKYYKEKYCVVSLQILGDTEFSKKKTYSTELAPKPGRPESVVNDRNVLFEKCCKKIGK